MLEKPSISLQARVILALSLLIGNPVDSSVAASNRNRLNRGITVGLEMRPIKNIVISGFLGISPGIGKIVDGTYEVLSRNVDHQKIDLVSGHKYNMLGHSWGADRVSKLAERAAKEGIRDVRVVLIDPMSSLKGLAKTGYPVLILIAGDETFFSGSIAVHELSLENIPSNFHVVRCNGHDHVNMVSSACVRNAVRKFVFK